MSPDGGRVGARTTRDVTVSTIGGDAIVRIVSQCRRGRDGF